MFSPPILRMRKRIRTSPKPIQGPSETETGVQGLSPPVTQQICQMPLFQVAPPSVLISTFAVWLPRKFPAPNRYQNVSTGADASAKLTLLAIATQESPNGETSLCRLWVGDTKVDEFKANAAPNGPCAHFPRPDSKSSLNGGALHVVPAGTSS